MNLRQLKNIYTILFLLIINILYLYGCVFNTESKVLNINKRIYIKDGIYLIYKGFDKDGCKYYVPYSENNKTINAIYYITKKNQYTLNKNKAECNN
ncbi:MAG: hypothetical protein CFH01_01668 [Alphaproteobacteria bacterium MarineAlpha2_Bin1]|nr:MAG: hypothetical protein CFH01_01668 [Alphaproteobacteria bacterium MarineAlpha2_Bin1]|tara:strand:- start:1681 stop:1968 length:288 start_codon:yes stop_codon:yes gene_type:complete